MGEQLNNVRGAKTKSRLVAAVLGEMSTHGLGGHSLRALAASVGTTHRVLIYHFGSKQGLLAAVVQAMDVGQRQLLAEVLDSGDPDAHQRLRQLWTKTTDQAAAFGPFFFEIAALAMRNRSIAQSLRHHMVDFWLENLTEVFIREGVDPRRARAAARLGLAAGRGLLFDLLLTGDTVEVEEAMDLLVELLSSRPGQSFSTGA